VRFSWGSYLGLIFESGFHSTFTAFGTRERLGVDFQFNRTVGLELSLSVDMIFGATAIVFLFNPTIGLVLAL